MKVLLTGTTGYIAQRLLPVLLNSGHEVVCCVRDRLRFDAEKYHSEKLSVIEVDFIKAETLGNIPEDIDAAYYLVHSMASRSGNFEDMEKISAENFVKRIGKTNARQLIFLSGIVNGEILSKHLESRRNVERILASGSVSLTTLRAGIIIGAGSASFEIIRDLVEKLPVMVAPDDVLTLRCGLAQGGHAVAALHLHVVGGELGLGAFELLDQRAVLLYQHHVLRAA